MRSERWREFIMLRKVKKLWNILKYFFQDEDNLLLHLMEMKAYESLDDCFALDVGMTEEIEDFIFHIKTYYDIPQSVAATSYPDMKVMDIPTVVQKYKAGKMNVAEVERFADFLADIEKQRAVERDIIFEYAKVLSFGFKL
jgi:hypothetical protein